MKGITFGNLHTYKDLNMILTHKSIGTPSPKTNMLDIPGGDGMLDMTEFFGEVKYGNRPMTYEFSTAIPYEQFPAFFSRVQNALHGQKVPIVDDEDQDFYYLGRLTVSEFQAKRAIGVLAINCDCEPFKYKARETVVTAILDGTSRNMYDISKVLLPFDSIKKREDDFFEINADNKTGAWQYPTFFHSPFPEGQIAPNQNVTLIMETKDFTVSGPGETKLYFTSHQETQPDYFSPASHGFNLATHDRNTVMQYPASIKDAATIAKAVYFIRSFIALANGNKCKGLFRVSVLPGDARNTPFVYTSYDGKMRGLQLANGKRRVIPSITATSAFTLYFEGNTYTVGAGTSVLPEIELKEGINDITVKGTGTITFTYREGIL